MLHEILKPALRGFLILTLGLGCAMGASFAAQAEPINVYLTYRDNPSESIVVNYHLRVRMRDAPDPVVYLDTQSRDGEPGAYAEQVVGEKKEMDLLPEWRTINWINLTGLEPDTVYYFIAGDEDNGFTEERSFRTVPADDAPLRFVTGGDVHVMPRSETMLQRAAEQDPLFCAIGGDIAYVDGRFWDLERWDGWFDNYDRHMRTSEGHMIPILMGIGNHETNRLPTTDPVIKAPFYTAYFGQQQADNKTYFKQQFGENILFLVLDSNHITPHAGEQAAWLAETLAEHRDFRYKFAMYHVPLYPSFRPFETANSVAGRIHWEPLFSAYGLTTAFENHDHTLKRSKLLFNGEISDKGVLYIGDGSMGVNPRIVEDEIRWYLELQSSLPHVWVVDVSNESIRYQAIGEEGGVLDDYQHPLPQSTAAAQ